MLSLRMICVLMSFELTQILFSTALALNLPLSRLLDAPTGGGYNKSMDNADDAVRMDASGFPLTVAPANTSAYPPIHIRVMWNTHTRV